jgi:phage head maturation protease
VVHHEHNVAIGIARLTEVQGLGIAAHGRIAVLTATGILVAVGIQQGFLKQFCLSTESIRGTRMTGADNREFLAIPAAQPRELSICLRGGIPGTGIQQWGGLSLTQTSWDRRFYPEGAEILNSETANLLQFFADIRAKSAKPFDRGEYENWINNMGF